MRFGFKNTNMLISFTAVTIFLLSLGSTSNAGPGKTGGGDPWCADFINVAVTEVIPFLEKNGSTLSIPVDAKKAKAVVFRMYSQKKVSSLPVVHESCDGSKTGRLVAGCYNAKKDRWYISQSSYPKDDSNSLIFKRHFVLHEILRAMGLEGDGYEVVRSIGRAHPKFNFLDQNFKACVAGYNQSVNMAASMDACIELSIYQINFLDNNFKECIAGYSKSLNMFYSMNHCTEPSALRFNFLDGNFKECVANYSQSLNMFYAMDKCRKILDY